MTIQLILALSGAFIAAFMAVHFWRHSAARSARTARRAAQARQDHWLGMTLIQIWDDQPAQWRAGNDRDREGAR